MSIAIITGASSGIGSEFVRLLGEYADVTEVWAIARRKERLEQLNVSENIKLRPIAMDLRDKKSFETIAKMLSEESKKVDVLINCAGYGKFGEYCDIDLESELGMIDLNCRALVGMTETVLPFMTEGSKILQVCSIASFQPLPLANVYAASKVFVLNYSRGLSVELKRKKISVTALCPGWVDTDFFATATDTENPKAVTKYTFMQTPKRVAKQGLRAMKKGRLTTIVGAQNKILYVLDKNTSGKVHNEYVAKNSKIVFFCCFFMIK